MTATARDRNNDGTEFFYAGDQPDSPVNVYACVNPKHWPGAVKIVAGNPPVMALSMAEKFAQAILDAVKYARKPDNLAGVELRPFRVKSNHEVFHVPHPLNPDVSLCGIRFDDTWSVRLSAREAVSNPRLWGCHACHKMTELLAESFDLPEWPTVEAQLEEAEKLLTLEAFNAVLWDQLMAPTGDKPPYLLEQSGTRTQMHAAAAVGFARWRQGERDALKHHLEDKKETRS